MYLLAKILERVVRIGTLRVFDAHGRLHVFSGSSDPFVTIRLSDKTLHRKLLLNLGLYAGEAYMDGTLTLEECTLYDALQLFALNWLSREPQLIQTLLRRFSRLTLPLRQYNPIRRARKNAAHHYDLSSDLFRLFLDDDLQYSCAYFLSDNDTLEQAQENKKRHIVAKLLLEPGQKILDIGSGWGGLAFYLAACADVEVTGVTLSKEQLQVSRERARVLALADRVHFELRDYREIEKRFDRVVSVGMFEHVGVYHYGEFFAKIRELLADDGVALIHAIGRMGPPGTTNPWVRKYIFPGGYTPALSEVLAALEPRCLWVTDIEILRLHYADTLREWYRRFRANREKVAKLYDERFCRMWELYLVSAEMVFRYGDRMVFQMQIARQRDAVPLTRDYATAAERAYLRREKQSGRARNRGWESLLLVPDNSPRRNSKPGHSLAGKAGT